MVISRWLASDGGLLRHYMSSPWWCSAHWLHPRCCHGDMLCVCVAFAEAVRQYELFRRQYSGPPATEGEKSITWLWAWITCGWSRGLFYTRWENHWRHTRWNNTLIPLPFYFNILPNYLPKLGSEPVPTVATDCWSRLTGVENDLAVVAHLPQNSIWCAY